MDTMLSLWEESEILQVQHCVAPSPGVLCLVLWAVLSVVELRPTFTLLFRTLGLTWSPMRAHLSGNLYQTAEWWRLEGNKPIFFHLFGTFRST
jgi:hypothetical protein